jgi:hypothetical protein
MKRTETKNSRATVPLKDRHVAYWKEEKIARKYHGTHPKGGAYDRLAAEELTRN